MTTKSSNIILRTDETTHNIIKLKSILFNNGKKSEYLRNASLSYWGDITDRSIFKELLRLYQEGDESDKELIVSVLFEYYRRAGFPYVILNNEQKINRMNRIVKTEKILLEDDHLQQNVVGLDLVNSFHPHMMEARYSDGSRSPKETFDNDEWLKDCINRWLELKNVPNPSGMRRILKTRDKSRGVVNFKSSIAKFIYQTYVPVDGRVLDPCSGYSGRLAGCIAANKNILYHGIDPDGRTARGNMECASFFNSLYYENVFNNKMYNFRFRFDLGCAEDIMRDIKDEYDLIFSSSPYYNVECYSEECSQSYKRYETYESWLNNFLFVIVDESYRLLKEGGRLALNIKNTYKYKIADDLCKYCEGKWNLEKTYHMRLSNSEYHRVDDKPMFHTEPIYIFAKK